MVIQPVIMVNQSSKNDVYYDVIYVCLCICLHVCLYIFSICLECLHMYIEKCT